MTPASLAERALIVVPATAAEIDTTGNGGGVLDAKRLLDIVGSLILIVFLAPVMLLVAVAVYLIDGSHPIYAHRRVGRGGASFRCFKYQTMCRDADRELERLLMASPELRAQWQRDHKLEPDPRVTRLGCILRITSLDELPQLFNVLSGDMTLVGPRPIVASELSRYGRYVGHYSAVRPGLTGLWQVSGRSMTTYRRRVAADVVYVRSQSMVLDLWILARTVPAVLTCRGSY
ncbi:MAG: sugar transferase [Sphingomonadales bacterium]|nr:sugar transferase [Sphingomonadales bacterium]